jgi:hypothetical protein
VDARADAAAAGDAAVGSVSVAVTLGGAPAAGAHVYFQNADSSLVAGGSAVTDASGFATATITAGGFVSVVEPEPPLDTVTYRVDTFSDVQPGVLIHDDVPPNPTTGPGRYSVQFQIPKDPRPTVVQYQLVTSCLDGAELYDFSASAPLDDLAVDVTCETDHADVQVTSIDHDGRTLGSITATGVALGSNALANGSGVVPATVVALAGAYEPLVAVTNRVVDTPQDLPADLVTTYVAAGSDAPVFQAFDSRRGSDGTEIVDVPQVANGIVETTLSAGGHVVLGWAPSPGFGVTLDVAANTLADEAGAATADPATGAVTWTLAGAGATPDYAFADVTATRPGAAGVATRWVWRAIGPTDGALQLPRLPADVFDFNLAPGDATQVGCVVAGTYPGGYAAALQAVTSTYGLASAFSAASTGTLAFRTADAGNGPCASATRIPGQHF